MSKIYKTPGVFIEEKDAFPSSAVAVATAIPVFIGYTEKAGWKGKSLLHIPTCITSFAEYTERFGGGFQAKFKVIPSDDSKPDKQGIVIVGEKPMLLKINQNNTAYFFNSIRLFYANGGGHCCILAIGTYQDKKNGFEIKAEDFIGSTVKPDPFEILKKEFEPTLVVVPDAIALGANCYNNIYTKVLAHCAEMQNRFAIFDLVKQLSSESTSSVAGTFREKIGTHNLNYGAAYYPWLKTTIVQPDEITFENIDDSVDLTKILPAGTDQGKALIGIIEKLKKKKDPTDKDKLEYNQALKAWSPAYNLILEGIRSQLNELPPSGAIAGIYTLVDNSRDVWKAPANISLNMVNAPTVNISQEQQESLNVDVMTGKSINVIRSFPGLGTLVWGARTLDGNSQDWRYINVRRTLIMIEESLKLAARAYVLEPNNDSTWTTVKGMMVSFLTNLWKQGALAGAVPEQAFDVQIGLGATMTAFDILDGIMKITVKVAIVHPAGFIVITFQQQMQKS